MKDDLSALVDGDLDDSASGRVFDALRRDPELRRKWLEYCLIGDAVRGELSGAADISSSVMERIREEPTLFAPVHAKASEAARSSANSLWSRALMPVAASVMGVAVVGVVAMSMRTTTAEPTIAIGTQTATVEQGVLPVASGAAALTERGDPHRKYVFVHQAMSGGSPLSGAVQYVRTVSADMAGDVRR